MEEKEVLRAKDTYIVSTARYCCCNRSAGEHSSTIALSVAAGGGQWPIFQSSYAPYRSDNVLFSSHNALRHGRLHLIISPLLQQSLSRWVIIAGMKKNSLPVFRVLRFVSFDFGRGSRLYWDWGDVCSVVLCFNSGLEVVKHAKYWQQCCCYLFIDT